LGCGTDVNRFNRYQELRKNHGNYHSTTQARMKLPSWSFKEQIISTIKGHNITLVSGSTGCGKSTQVPQFLLDSEEVSRREAGNRFGTRLGTRRGKRRGNVRVLVLTIF
jgi:HrpA-like RNA helicase